MAVDIVSTFLLDSELFDSCTFEEFQELFPQRYRHCQDVQLLYRAFRRQRRILRDSVQRSIETRYDDNVQLLGLEREGQHIKSLDNVITELMNIKRDLQEDLDDTRENIVNLRGKLEGVSEVITQIKKFDELSENIDHKTLKEVSKFIKTEDTKDTE